MITQDLYKKKTVLKRLRKEATSSWLNSSSLAIYSGNMTNSVDAYGGVLKCILLCPTTPQRPFLWPWQGYRAIQISSYHYYYCCCYYYILLCCVFPFVYLHLWPSFSSLFSTVSALSYLFCWLLIVSLISSRVTNLGDRYLVWRTDLVIFQLAF